MSNLIPQTQVSDSFECPTLSTKIKFQHITTRDAVVGGGLPIKRALPHRDRRMVGAWCFFDHFGPVQLQDAGLNVGPHPHMGLQTFTYLVEGKILHRDSLGTEQLIEPGQVNLMSAGIGISHSEESVKNHLTTLHGVQLWIALPNKTRNDSPNFVHYENLPLLERDGLLIKILAGTYLNKTSPVKVYSPLLGCHIYSEMETTTTIPLNPQFEHGILVLNGQIKIDDQLIDPGTLLFAPCGHQTVVIHAMPNTHIFLIGGEPFNEEVLLWWNFVARTREEIEMATTQWQLGERFGVVTGYIGNRLEAPAVPWK